MITRDKFVDIMVRLEELEYKQDAVDKALHELCEDFGSFYCSEYLTISMELLGESLNDTEDWLGYFVFDCDWLDTPVTIGLVDGTNLEISNWYEVYDFITNDENDTTKQCEYYWSNKPPVCTKGVSFCYTRCEGDKNKCIYRSC